MSSFLHWSSRAHGRAERFPLPCSGALIPWPPLTTSTRPILLLFSPLPAHRNAELRTNTAPPEHGVIPRAHPSPPGPRTLLSPSAHAAGSWRYTHPRPAQGQRHPNHAARQHSLRKGLRGAALVLAILVPWQGRRNSVSHVRSRAERRRFPALFFQKQFSALSARHTHTWVRLILCTEGGEKRLKRF